MLDTTENTNPVTAPDPLSRIFHTLLVFRCPTTLSEALAAYAARRGSTNVSEAIRELLTQALNEERERLTRTWSMDHDDQRNDTHPERRSAR